MPPFVNNLMKLILRSPIHGLISKNILLITFTGRKSGKSYQTPVSYSQRDGQVTIFTHAKWWKNFVDGAPVTLRMQGRELMGTAVSIAEDKQAIATALTTHLKKQPFDAKFYDVTFDEDGNPITTEIEQAVQTTVMIQVQLRTEEAVYA